MVDPCKMRMPNSFLINVSTVGISEHDNQPGHPVAIRIRLTQPMDMCGLLVKITAKNRAGMSSPTEIETDGELAIVVSLILCQVCNKNCNHMQLKTIFCIIIECRPTEPNIDTGIATTRTESDTVTDDGSLSLHGDDSLIYTGMWS